MSEQSITSADFKFGKTLGKGAYSKVVEAEMVSTNQIYAIKIIEKAHVKKHSKIFMVLAEKKALIMLQHSLIIKLFYTFQDRSYLYFAMEVCHHDLHKFIQNSYFKQDEKGISKKACDMHIARFYSAEILLALQYIHSLGIIHRDLKPENILITESGHIKLCDFGTAYFLNKDDRVSDGIDFVGTAEYVSPEVLKDEPIYNDDSEYLIFQAIKKHCEKNIAIRFDDVFDLSSRDFITKLLLPDPSSRLGCGALNEHGELENIQEHSFFVDIHWDDILTCTPPFDS